MIRFIDREEELETLEMDNKNSENAFVVVYGRRRIGKTRLLEEFFKNKNVIKYIAEDVNKKIQINEIKEIFSHYLKDEFLASQDISEWGTFFSYLSKVLDKNNRIYIWIDEFSYLVKNDKSLTSVLQKFIDAFLRESKLFFVVSGSLFGLMKEDVLANSSPLYGRRTRDILLRQIPANYIHYFFNMKFQDVMQNILTIGGVSEYLIVASKYKNYIEFIKKEFLKRDGYFYREPYFLLSQEFKEIKTYFSILNAISYGNTKPSEIANFVGLNTREIYPYLDLLISYDFVRRIVPVLGDNKRGIYYINDVFFDFWFNFIFRNRDSIERGTCEIDVKELNSFFGKRFEIFIRDNFHLILKGRKFSGIGKQWGNYFSEEGKTKSIDIDIVTLNEKTKEILFCECKWQDRVNALEIVNELSKKAGYVNWNLGKRKEHYVVFAKSFSKRIKEFDGKKVFCYDLRDIERGFRG